MNHRNCGSCRWLMRHVNANGQPISFTARNTYRCLWPMPEIPLPTSITNSYRLGGMRAPPRRHMLPQEGENCPTWELGT
jgi:hypothetical protein